FERGSNFTPALVDIDADGDLDLFAGEASGEMNFVRNVGSKTAPMFKLESETFQQIDAGRRSHPAFADLDGDGDYDLITGNENGGVVYYRNDGNSKEPRFVSSTAFTLPLPPMAAPVFVDINGDKVVELFTGSLSGGITFWRR
ncbi:MAG TPA: FG-GAP-like repeat-containing protein, partial [Longimicrobiales bacterium]